MCPGAEPRWCWIKTEREAGADPQTSCFGFGLGLGMAVCRSLLGSRRGGRRWRGRCRRRQRRARRALALPLPAGPKRRPVGDTAATVRPPWRLLSATSSAPAQRPKPQRRRTRSTTSPTTSRDEAKWIPDRTNTKRIRLSHNDTDFSPTHGDSAAAYVPVVRSVVIMSGPSHSPQRIGVVARSSQRIRDRVSFDDFASFVDHSTAAAIDLFSELTPGVELPSTSQPLLRNAG